MLSSFSDAIGLGVAGWCIRWAVKLLAGFGVAVITQKLFVGPMFDHVRMLAADVGGGEGAEWIAMTNLDAAIGILAAAYAIRAFKRTFLGTPDQANAN